MFTGPGNPYVSYMSNLEKDSKIHNYEEALYRIEKGMKAFLKELEEKESSDIENMDAKSACIKGANMMYSIFINEKQRL